MAIDVPEGGYKTIDQAASAISEIMNRSSDGEADGSTGDGEAVPNVEPKSENTDSESDNTSDNEEFSGGEEAPEGPEDDRDLADSEGISEEDDGDNTEESEYDYAALAQALDLNESDIVVEDGKLLIRAKVNEKEIPVSLGDLKNGYQMVQAGQKGLQELSLEKKKFSEERDSQLNALQEQATFYTQALHAIEQDYVNDFNSTDWEKLRQEDPDAFNDKWFGAQQRAQKIDAYKKQYEQVQKAYQDQLSTRMQEVWVEGAKLLESSFTGPEYRGAPAWDDKERQRLTKWMVDQGMEESLVSTLQNWQVFKWARDSMLRSEEQETAIKTMKKVAKLPKVKMAKPGPASDSQSRKRSSLDRAKQKQRKATAKGKKNFNESVDLISQILGHKTG